MLPCDPTRNNPSSIRRSSVRCGAREGRSRTAPARPRLTRWRVGNDVALGLLDVPLPVLGPPDLLGPAFPALEQAVDVELRQGAVRVDVRQFLGIGPPGGGVSTSSRPYR